MVGNQPRHKCDFQWDFLELYKATENFLTKQYNQAICKPKWYAIW